MDSKIVPIGEAVKLVTSGSSITISGMSIHRNPMGFLFKLAETEVRDLTFIDREPGVGLEFLLKKNMIKRIRAAMPTLEWFSGTPIYFRKKVESGEVEYIEDTCGAFIAGIRAAAFGIPFMPVRGIIGSDLVKLHEKLGSWKVIKDPFSGEDIVVVKAIEPDVAIIHVHKADKYGNSEILGPVYEDEFKARASKKVIITAEEIVPESYFYSRKPTIPAEYVTGVVHLPRGAEPTSMFGLYDADYEGIIKLLELF